VTTFFPSVGNEAHLIREAQERTSRAERAIRPHARLYFTRRGGMASEGELRQFGQELDVVILGHPVHERVAEVEDTEGFFGSAEAAL
jgi:hypothetical protein